ncbi:plancitoxin-1-like [Glandiceps talaboti]
MSTFNFKFVFLRTVAVVVIVSFQAVLARVIGDGGFTCKDPDGKSVDWFIVYKLPEIEDSSDTVIQEGLGYYYMDVNSQYWTLSDIPINDTNHAVAHTLQQIYSNHGKSDLVYMMYNDEWPNGKESMYRGHTKGDLCFNRTSGFWLVHSVPKFPDFSNTSYSWPDNAKDNGQSFLCVTYGYNELAAIAKQLKYMWPYVYDVNIPKDFVADQPDLVDVANKKHIKNPPWFRQENLTSLAGQKFYSFTKTSEYGKDIYADWLAPYFQSDMQSETWQDGRGKTPSFCGTYKVENIQDITFSDDVVFKETKDHSKWAVTMGAKSWTCIGGINRQDSQTKRGGGLVCFNIISVWKQFTSIISQVEECNGVHHDIMLDFF